MTFCSLESRSPIKNVIKHHVQVFFKENDTQEISNFCWNLWVNPFGKMDIVPLC